MEKRGDKAECVICQSKDDLTVDHIVPKTKGGNNHHTNKAIVCQFCNITKSDKSVEEMLIWYEERINMYAKHIIIYKRLKAKMEKIDIILEELREHYRRKEYAKFKNKFYKNIFFIPKEKRDKILRVLDGLKIEPEQEEKKWEAGSQMLIDTAINELGWKLEVDKDDNIKAISCGTCVELNGVIGCINPACINFNHK